MAGNNEAVPFDEAWDGCMITYTEQDFPTSEPYQRSVPGWACKSCGFKIGTSGLPPRECPRCQQRRTDP